MLSVQFFLQFVAHVLSIFDTTHVLTLNLEENLLASFPKKIFTLTAYILTGPAHLNLRAF